MGKTEERIEGNSWKEIEREFPGDPALQQIHYARKLISKEVKEKWLILQEYIKNYSQEE